MRAEIKLMAFGVALAAMSGFAVDLEERGGMV